VDQHLIGLEKKAMSLINYQYYQEQRNNALKVLAEMHKREELKKLKENEQIISPKVKRGTL